MRASWERRKPLQSWDTCLSVLQQTLDFQILKRALQTAGHTAGFSCFPGVSSKQSASIACTAQAHIGQQTTGQCITVFCHGLKRGLLNTHNYKDCMIGLCWRICWFLKQAWVFSLAGHAHAPISLHIVLNFTFRTAAPCWIRHLRAPNWNFSRMVCQYENGRQTGRGLCQIYATQAAVNENHSV